MMASLIDPERVVPCLRARDVLQVIDEMARIAAAEAPLSHALLRQEILDRGKASVFGFGRGVAIPHAAIPGLAQPLGVFARLSPPQDFGAADEMPADLAFLLLSPAGDDPTHLRALACAVRRLRDGDVAARLRSAKDAEAIHIVLTSDIWRGVDEQAWRPGKGPAIAPGRDLTNAKMCTSIEASC